MLTRALAVALLLAALAACDADPAPPAPPAPASRPSSATASPPATPVPTTDAVGRPAFRADVRRLTRAEREAMTGVSWHEGCPVGLDRLRLVRLTYWDWRRQRRTGALVVRRDVTGEVVSAFRALYDARFPIRRMRPVDAYDGDDYTSIEADNTSAFNCRPATGSTAWSQHAYGIAIDVNPLENPYVYDRSSGGRTSHPRSEPYLDRTTRRRGVLRADGDAVAAFESLGWVWGGRWAEPTDYQHFSLHPFGTPDRILATEIS